MLDIKLIRERPDFVKAELAKRGVEPAEVDRLLEVDQKRRKLQAEVDQLRADRKRRAREVGKLPPAERAAEIAKIRAEEADEREAGEGRSDRCQQPVIDLGHATRCLPRSRSRSWRSLSRIFHAHTLSLARARLTTASSALKARRSSSPHSSRCRIGSWARISGSSISIAE